ncbi:hypothetical protein [Actinopolymorpha alba]|uniref:baeRF10 domain-containing protein n=1 Tax=Actinopolymorpha alba TaxID=533267 RepID=UPI0003717473|nr:hypothetical protein [Actinopolymorpha alba]
MIDVKQVERLLRYHDSDGALVSVYFTVPTEAAGLRELSVRLDGLLASIEPPPGVPERSRHAVRLAVEEAKRAVREAVTEHVRDWLGHGVAILHSGMLRVHENLPVCRSVPDRVVVGPRPYLRPLLAAVRECRPYHAVVVDRRNAWVFRIDGDSIEPVSRLVGKGLRDPSHAGWAGLEEYRVRQRAAELARRHYRSTASTLDALLRDNDREFVVGGHEVSIVEFIGLLPDWLRQRVAGTFVVDPHTMTSGELRERCEQARGQASEERERRLRAELADREAGGRAVSGLERCAEAVSQSDAELLVVSGDNVVPGYVCDACGQLVVDETEVGAGLPCPRCGKQARLVPDIVDEMLARVMLQRGQVEFIAGESLDGTWIGAMLRRRLVRQGAEEVT